jgi:pimeloyl-ACP methyl ester carboxylesterase
MANDLALETLYFDTAEGIRLHAKACGPARAPVLLFVHGFPEFWYTWRRQLAEFSADFRCVAIDLRGFNLSSQPLDVSAYKPHLLVADLRGVIQALGAPVFAVIAHDWGGAVAWSLAAQHPELMQNFVVLNAPHTILFAKALASDTGQQAAGAYMNVLRLPGSESLLAKDGHAWLRDLLGELSDEELQAYRGCWAHGLAGGCNYYRASPLHPDTPDAPGPDGCGGGPARSGGLPGEGAHAGHLGHGRRGAAPGVAGGAGAARERPARPPHRGRRPLGDTVQRR